MLDVFVVTIIIPVYNASSYLKKCIDSVLTQSYHSLEVVLVDDGSNDGSDKICDYYAMIDKRVKVIHKSNSGVADARNIGIDTASGFFIMFVDSDDYIENDYVEQLVQIYCKSNADLVCSNYVIDGVNPKSSLSLISETRLINNKEQLLENYITSQPGFQNVNTQREPYGYVVFGKLFVKDKISKIRFQTLKYGEDTSFMIDALMSVNSVFLLAENKGYHYYQNEKSAVHTAVMSSMYLNHLEYTKKLLFYSRNLNYKVNTFEEIHIKKIYCTLSYLIKEKNYKNYLKNKNYLRNNIDLILKSSAKCKEFWAIKLYTKCPEFYWKIMSVVLGKNCFTNIYNL